MSKVLVRKAERPVMMVGGDGSQIMVPVGSSRKNRLPDVREDRYHRTGTDLDAARLTGREAAQQLASFKHPDEEGDPVVAETLRRERAKRKVAVDRAKPQSYREKYAGDAAGRFLNRQVGVERSGEVTSEDKKRANMRAAAAGKVGVMGRRFGRGLAGALGGLSFLTGLESAGAAGQGFEQGLGSAAFRAQTTYGQTAPELADLGGEAGARIGAGGVGVRHRLQDRAAARAARQPVAIAQPTGPPPAPPRGPFPTEAEKQRTRDAAAARAWGQDMNAPAFQAGFAGPMAEQNYERATEQAANMLPPASSIFTPSAHEQMTAAGMVRQPDGQYTIGQPTAPVAVTASPTTESPKIPTTAQGMLEGLGIPNVNQKEEEKIADPTGGKDAAEAGAALAEKFSGKKQSMSNMGVEE
jgi:hypothetical protein